MKVVNNMLMSIPLCLLLSCCKPEPIKPKVEVTANPVLWKFETGMERGLASNNFIYKNTIIQGADGDGKWGKIWALSLDSGKMKWESETLPFLIPFNNVDAIVHENILLLASCQKDRILALNLDNGKKLWEYVFEACPRTLSIINNIVYVSGIQYQNQYGQVERFNVLTGQKLSPIVKLNRDDFDNYLPMLTAPAHWKHPNGDDILFFANRSYNGNLFPDYDRYDQLAYNLTADTMLWYKKGEPGIRGSIATPLVLGNKVMYYVSREMICLNPLNGERIWTFTRTPADDISGFNTANITHVGNTIIAKPDYKYMYGVDLQTGNTLWTNSENSSMPGTVRVALNKVWFSSGGIWCIDGVTGKTLIKGWQNKTAGNFISPIAIDEKTGYIYTQKQGIIYCLDSKVLME